MKYAAMAIGFLGVIPLSMLLRSNAYLRDRFWILFGLFPFVLPALPQLDFEIYTWDHAWVGHTSGMLISAIDLIAIAAYIALRHQKNSIRYHLPFIIYLSAISLSVFQAEQPTAAVFYVWQFIRIYFFVIVISKACTEETVPDQFMKGLALGLVIQIIFVVYQKLVVGALQPTGTFNHQNTLGLVNHLVVFPHFALLLAGRRQLQYLATPLIGFLVASIIASRAALGFCVMGFVACYLLSLVHRPSRWKAFLGVISVVVAAALAPIALSALEDRFAVARPMESQYDERAAFNRAARAMLEDHPFGIGANHYSYIGKNYGYSVRAGVAPVEGSLNNIVHNAYLLNAAESGYFGLFAFILLLLHPMYVAFRYSWVATGDPRAAHLLGLGTAMLIVYAHSLYEYILVIQESQYAFAVIVGLTYGLAHQIKQARLVERSGAAGTAVYQPFLQGSAGSLLR